MRDRSAWAGRGRATIDPNHSPQVEADNYLTATTPAQQQAMEAIVEDAQHDLLRRAHPPTVVTDADAAALVRDYPQLVASLELDDTVIAELVGGAARRVRRGLRRSAVRPARPEGQTLPGPAMGVPALPAGGVRAPARGEPVAAQGILLPPMAADAHRAVHGRVRPLRPPHRPSPGPVRPGGPGPRRSTTSPTTTPNFRCVPRRPPGDRRHRPAPPTSARRSVFAGADVCHEAGLTLPDGARRPIFDDDVWDFTEVVGLPTSWQGQPPLRLHRHRRRRWRLVAKEPSWLCSPRATRRSPRCLAPTGPRIT